MKLNAYFTDVLSGYSVHKDDMETLWEEIRVAYTAPGRHYHNLDHLDNMLGHLLAVRGEILRWDAIVLALCYHDIVYEALKTDNEAQSAALAGKRLRDLSLPGELIGAVHTLIMSTQVHALHAADDINLFTDADLSILGAEVDTYRQYAGDIRKEYAAVPDELYYPGRQRVLEHFLKMDHVFKTTVFREQYEQQARANLALELLELKKV